MGDLERLRSLTSRNSHSKASNLSAQSLLIWPRRSDSDAIRPSNPRHFSNTIAKDNCITEARNSHDYDLRHGQRAKVPLKISGESDPKLPLSPLTPDSAKVKADGNVGDVEVAAKVFMF